MSPVRLLPANHDERWLALGNLVNTFGIGATMTALTVYLARVKELSLGQAGTVLAVAGVIGFFGSAPLGHYADRRGPRFVAILTELTCAVAMLGLVLATPLWTIVVCLGVRQFAGNGNAAARGALMGVLVPEERRTALRAYQRTVTNLGLTLGALVAGVAIAHGGALP